MGSEDLSERQVALLQFIESYIQEQGRPPTNREIGADLGILSTGHVNYHLSVLEKKSYISREPRKSRGIRVLRSLIPPEYVPEERTIPIMGTIAAGSPLEFFRGHGDLLDWVNPSHYASGAYALQVKGDSMIEDGILEGDYVIVEPNHDPHQRDIIVATNTLAGAEGAATLKRFFREERAIRLQPANSNYSPYIISQEEWDTSWQVQGRVAAIIRPYNDR